MMTTSNNTSPASPIESTRKWRLLCTASPQTCRRRKFEAQYYEQAKVA